MVEALFNGPEYLATKKAMDATVMRQEAIASNLANIETPGYKRIDIAPSFESQLQQAIGSGDANQINGLQPSLSIDSDAVASRTDGNTVQLESEMLKLDQNSVEDAVETQVVSWSLGKLRMAVVGHG